MLVIEIKKMKKIVDAINTQNHDIRFKNCKCLCIEKK